MQIASRPDHVAIAVRDINAALPRWQQRLGGVVQWHFHTPTVFRGALLQFMGGACLEMLMPSDATERTRAAGGPSGFVDAFLDRFGTRVHHITLKVPDLQDALEVLEAAGFSPRDVNMDDPGWREAFLRPSEVGGVIVQIASSDKTNEDWAATNGHSLPGAPNSGPRLLGPQLVHENLDRAREIWMILGGTVTDEPDGGLLVSWPDEPLTVAIASAGQAAAIGLRFHGTDSRPSDPMLGPPVLHARI